MKINSKSKKINNEAQLGNNLYLKRKNNFSLVKNISWSYKILY